MKTTKLEIFGDSILKGVIYIKETGRYTLYGRTLEERLSERGVSAHRNCYMGCTVDAGLARLRRFIERADADGETLNDCTVLLEYGGNDCAYNWKEVAESPDASHTPVTTPDTFVSLYQQAIDCAKSRGAQVMLATLIPIDAEKYMNFISRDLAYDNILRWLGDISMLYRWHEGYNRAVEALAKKNNCQLIDLRERFLVSHEFPSLLCGDGIHPTREGHRIIEDALVAAL